MHKIQHRFSHRKPKPQKTCAVMRYGAMGDQIQSSSVLPQLKAQGYHITFYTVKMGITVLAKDPHIDAFVLQEPEKIPNHWLGDFVKHLETKFDRVINLSESVERTLLAMPGNMNHTWPHALRNKHLNRNYLEFMHDVADVPYVPAAKFYPTPEEATWARAQLHAFKTDYGRGKVILWSMQGSALHKIWPHLDAAIEAVTNHGISVVTVGDNDSTFLEQGYETNPLIYCRSGKWSIRQSLAFAQVADLVIGTETGLLNSVAFLPVKKIVCMSHSSVENLTRDWINCVSLTPEDTPCWPCHRMHYSYEFCHKGYQNIGGEMRHTGALCAVNISAQAMCDAVADQLQVMAAIICRPQPPRVGAANPGLLPSAIDEIHLQSLRELAKAAPPGAFVEFGVYRGGSARVLAEVADVQQRELYLYDTFTGMPHAEEIDKHQVGDFADTDVELIRQQLPNAHVIAGVFPESIVPMPAIAFAHVDCDQYRSVIDAIDSLSPLMVEGGLMLFDDYRVLKGCMDAIHERFGDMAEILPEDGRALVRF